MGGILSFPLGNHCKSSGNENSFYPDAESQTIRTSEGDCLPIPPRDAVAACAGAGADHKQMTIMDTTMTSGVYTLKGP